MVLKLLKHIKMDPKFWGPGTWRLLHVTAAVAYSEQERLDFEKLVLITARVLPCTKCKEHFRTNLRKFPLRNYMSSNETLFLWTWLMHDAVNEAQGKTGAARPSFEDMYKFYFAIGDDRNSDFISDYQDPICHEVCNEIQAQETIKPNKSTPKFSVTNRKYKVRN